MEDCIRERLDRALCNTSWRHLYPEVIVHHLLRTFLDHCPVLIDIEGRPPPSPALRTFRCEAAWLTHTDLKRVVVLDPTEFSSESDSF